MGCVKWPVAGGVKMIPSGDSCIRKARLVAFRNGSLVKYIRPVLKVVLLVNDDKN